MKEKFLKILKDVKRIAENKKVKIIAVSKKQTVEKMNTWLEFCAENGIETLFGENYVKEFVDKKDKLNGEYQSHLIGPLQSNKVKKAVEAFDCIQSVHSLKLLNLIEKEASKLNKKMKVMLQINISDDENKSGFMISEIREAFENSKELKNVKIIGLMCITANYSDKEDVIPDFSRMKELRDELDSNLELSMGMSKDYDLAIQSGATMVRIGSSLFGERIY